MLQRILVLASLALLLVILALADKPDRVDVEEDRQSK